MARRSAPQQVEEPRSEQCPAAAPRRAAEVGPSAALLPAAGRREGAGEGAAGVKQWQAWAVAAEPAASPRPPEPAAAERPRARVAQIPRPSVRGLAKREGSGRPRPPKERRPEAPGRSALHPHAQQGLPA